MSFMFLLSKSAFLPILLILLILSKKFFSTKLMK